MNPVELMDKALVDTKEGEESRAGRYRVSNFGRCYRMQYWSRMGQPESNPIGAKTLRVFKLGDLIHDMVQRQYEPEQLEVEVETEDFKGHADIVVGDRVYDIKSIRSYGFKLMRKPEYDITADKLNNILQVMGYAYFLNRPGELLFFDKDSLENNLDIGKPFVFELKDWKDKVVEEMDILCGYWDQKKLPPAIARCYHGKECQYCCFESHCKEVEENV